MQEVAGSTSWYKKAKFLESFFVNGVA